MSKVNLKAVRESYNDAYDTLERIHNEFPEGNLDEKAQKEWNEAKNIVDEKKAILNREKILEENRAKNSATINDSGLDKKDVERFNYMDALKYAINPSMLNNKKRGLYSELNNFAQNEASSAGVSLQGGQGIVLPMSVLNSTFRNDLTIGTEGTDLVFEEDGGFIDALREGLVLTQMGADMMDGLIGDVKFPKETNLPTFTWEGETDSNAEHTPTFGQVNLSPNRGGTYIDVSNQALRQTSPSVQNRIRNQMLYSVQRGLENAAINSSGANSPSGILDISSLIGSGSVAYGDIVDLESEVASKFADQGSLGYITNAKARGVLKQTQKDSGSGLFLWEGDEMNGYPARVADVIVEDSDGVPEYSDLIFGNFNNLIMGMWGGVEILVDPYTQATSGITRMVVNVYADVAFLHDESFAHYRVLTSS